MSVPLPNYFRDTLGKQVTKANYIDLCMLAVDAPAIFQYAFRGAEPFRVKLQARDLADMYCTANGYPWHSAYARLVTDTLYRYDMVAFKDREMLIAIFDTFTEVFTKIDQTLTEAGMPSMVQR